MASCNSKNSCNPSNTGIFRNPQSGMVIGLRGTSAVLQTITGNQNQKWQMIEVDSVPCETRFYIKNMGTGTFLDIEGSSEGKPLVVFRETGSLTQQWYVNSDGSIVNVGTELAADICGEKFQEGTPLIAFRKHGNPNQVFRFQY